MALSVLDLLELLLQQCLQVMGHSLIAVPPLLLLPNRLGTGVS